MKKIILLFLVVALAACSNEKPKDPNTVVVMEEKLNEFIAANPDWAKNVNTEADGTDKFQYKAINWSNEPDFLKNMPLQFSGVRDTTINDQPLKMAVFKDYGDPKRPASSLLNFMHIQILGIVSDVQLKGLTANKNYTITGSLYKQGKRADVKFKHFNDFKEYTLGKYIFLITGFKPL